MCVYSRHLRPRLLTHHVTDEPHKRGLPPFFCYITLRHPQRMDMGHGTTAYTAFEDSQPRKRGGLISACWRVFCRCCSRSPPGGRLIRLNAGAPTKQRYPRNAVQNTKYSPITFVPKVLYEQFRCNVLRSGLPVPRVCVMLRKC